MTTRDDADGDESVDVMDTEASESCDNPGRNQMVKPCCNSTSSAENSFGFVKKTYQPKSTNSLYSTFQSSG